MSSPIFDVGKSPADVGICQQLNKQSEICESLRVQDGLKALPGQQNLQELIIKLGPDALRDQLKQRLAVAAMLDMREHLHADLECLISGGVDVGVGLQLVGEELRLLQRQRDEVLDDFE